jgi:ADP-ribose pyrophosphatase
MSDFDSADCLERYLALVRERPDRFTNPDGDIYEILLDTPRIDRARRDAERHRRDERLPSDDTRVGVLAVDPYLLVLRDAVRFADGSYGLYNRLLVPAGAAILPVLGDSIALLHRFRHGTRRWHLEAPRGAFSGVGTSSEEAQRELVEEIGSHATEIVDLGFLHSTTGCLDEEHQLFLARIASVGKADKHEAIESIKVLSTKHVERLIAEGDITDGPTLALFLRARLRGYLT